MQSTPPQPGPVNTSKRVPATLSGALEVPIVRNGLASTYGEGWSPSLIAVPDGPGVTFRVCGPADCLTLTSTDTGPDQRVFPDRVVDLPVWAFERVSGNDWHSGLTPVSLVILGRAVR